MKIEIGKILTSKNLYQLIENYWELSFDSEQIVFDFSQLEWVSNSEVVFIVGWINALSKKSKNYITIELQSSKDVSIDSISYKRRKNCLLKLFLDWNIENVIPESVQIVYQGINSRGLEWNSFSRIIPLKIVKYDYKTFDELFESIYKNVLEKSLSDIFIDKIELNYFDTNFLNYSIIKELYSNVCIHSNSKIIEKCFLSIGVKNKYKSEKGYEFISNQRINELSVLEKDFFIDSNEKYRNIDYVEFSIQDFGEGIVSSLKDKYRIESTDSLVQYFEDEYSLHLEQNIESKILHYSLLLFSSRFEVDRNFEIHDFIPRGLFILQEIIEKYQGYLEIFSNKGGIGISFKDGVKKISFVKKNNNKILFPGTRIRLVLPSLKEIDSSKNDIVNKPIIKNEGTNNIYGIHFLKEYTNIESRVQEKDRPAKKIEVKIISAFFQHILSKIQKEVKGSIVIIDFSGVDKDTLDVFNKFIYFISHCPINSLYRIILFNIVIKDLNSTRIFNRGNILKSKGFIPYPVPVVFPDLSIEWLGVNDKSIESILTSLWKGDSRNERQHIDFPNYSSTIIKIENKKKYKELKINLPSYSEVCEIIISRISEIISDEINNEGIQFNNLKNSSKDYNRVKIKKENTIFLNPNGMYQEEYLSFNEKLYVKSYRKMLATYFLYILEYSSKVNLNEINKILSVTLSSQFLGNEVKELLEKFYSNRVELVALSNYYHFQNEEGFNGINSSDYILVVNDIISTGNLTENIFQSVERKLASVIGCVSIVDLRLDPVIKNSSPTIFSLVKYDINKYESIPPNSKIEWINPILNAPVSMEKNKSNVITLFQKSEFLKHIDEEDLHIGKIKSNSYYMNYYLDTSQLLKKDLKKNFNFIRTLVKKFIENKKIIVGGELNNIINGLKVISKNSSIETNAQKINKVIAQLDKVKNPTLIYNYKVDIIFYPFLSKIGIIEENLSPFSDEIMNNALPKIYPIPRIMTSKGWRFSFPPKFLNILTQEGDKNILIIDDGSSSGDTIIQMIDSIAFLSVNSIDVISIFGRLEDFQKEFFSRIKSIKVKSKVVPINLIYGVHFNLPIYNSNDYPNQIELKYIRELENRFKKQNLELEDNFEEFLFKYKEKLGDIRVAQNSENSELLFKVASKKEMLMYRDVLGKFSSYRFFTDDLPLNGDFDFFAKNDAEVITFLSVLNLEPHLYQIIKRMLSIEKIEVGRIKILDLMDNIDYIQCEAKQMFFIKALFNINTREFVKSENLIRLVKLMQKNSYSPNAYRYTTYLLLISGLNIKSFNDVIVHRAFYSNMLDFAFELRKFDLSLFQKFRFFFESYRKLWSKSALSRSVNFPANKYYSLSEYFSKAFNNELSHSEKLLQNHFNEIEKCSIDLIDALNKDELELIKTQKMSFNISLEKLKKNYFEEYREYKYIKDIVLDLKNHSNIDMDFNPSLIFEAIEELENNINNIKKYDTDKINSFMFSIEKYIEIILKSNSDFFKFIINQKSNLGKVWNNCENSFFINRKDYKKINILSEMDYEIKVNPYILKLTFDNLLSNKYKYANQINWELSMRENSDSIELVIKQDSPFIKDKGDGTGQQIIKSILYNYGTLYKKINDNPYIIKIIFST